LAERGAAHRFAADVLRGLELVRAECGAARGLLLVDDDAVAEVCRGVAADWAPLAVEGAPDVYPVAPPGALAVPAELLRHVAAAADAGQPMTTRLVAVSGEVAEPCVLELPIGTRAQRALDLAGGALDPEATLMLGGCLRGVAALPADALDKADGMLAALPGPTRSRGGRFTLRRAVDACLQCRRCTDLCPPAQLGAPLAPHRALRALLVENGAQLATEAAHCTRCGVCFLACPYELDARAAYDATGVPFSQPVATAEPPALRLPGHHVRARLGADADDAGPVPLRSALDQVHEVALRIGAAPARVRAGQKLHRGDRLTDARPRSHASIDGT